MSSAKQGPTEKVAWIAGGLGVTASLVSMLGLFVGEPNALAGVTAAMTGFAGGVWLGRASEARSVRLGKSARLRP